MIISFLVGYAIGYAIGCIITEICIRISSYWNAKEEIKQKAQSQISTPISILEVFCKEQGKSYLLSRLDTKKNMWYSYTEFHRTFPENT